MIDTDILIQYIDNHYKNIEGISNKIISFANDLGMSYAGVYKIIRNKKTTIDTLVLMKIILDFSFDEIIVI